jgi:hypothetical protein
MQFRGIWYIPRVDVFVVNRCFVPFGICDSASTLQLAFGTWNSRKLKVFLY